MGSGSIDAALSAVTVLHFRRGADGRRTRAVGQMTVPPGVDPLALVRRFEPVFRYTAGELFFPMPIEDYVRESALWASAVDGRSGARPTLVVDHGDLTVDRLCAEGRQRTGAPLELRFVAGGLNRRELRAWRRDPDRPGFRTSARLAAVGLLGHIIEALFRLSLLVRGRVPAGLTAAIHVVYRRSPGYATHPYYARITDGGGYTAIQYWFFYAMNDWRTTFAGVNDHEGDWEQVTVYLTPVDPAHDPLPDDAHRADGSDCLSPAWVAFAAHEVQGRDLRRRHDDPDVTWVDRTHPVAHIGAGSHAAAPLAGEYLVRIEHPWLGRISAAAATVRDAIFPWTRGRARLGLGIPYVDYNRGDGRVIGPGSEHGWTPVIVDDSADWVRDFRGLWGLDTEDPFGGERAPAGPRYERSQEIRASWGDPVAWAGLDAVPATPAEAARAAVERSDELDQTIRDLDVELQREQGALRRLATGVDATTGGQGRSAKASARSDLAVREERLTSLRARRRSLMVEHESLAARRSGAAPVTSPHQHLRQRAMPEEGRALESGTILRVWTSASLSLLLALFGVALVLDLGSIFRVLLVTVVLVLVVDALLRRRIVMFLLSSAVIVAVAVVLVLFVVNWRFGVGGLAILSSLAVGLANIRVLLARR